MRKLLLATVCLSLAVSPVLAQQGNIPGAAVITNTARAAGTVTQVGTLNLNNRGVYCTFNQASEVGNPSTVISVEAQDATSGQWQSLGSSGAFAGNAGSVSLEIYPGVATSSLPAGMSAASLKVPTNWRLKQVITGGTSTTGSASCDLIN